MILRPTKIEDISRVIDIINQAKTYFKNNDIDQWQDGYPNEETIEKDIENKNLRIEELGNLQKDKSLSVKEKLEYTQEASNLLKIVSTFFRNFLYPSFETWISGLCKK